jgi:hypothetical protein
MFVDAQVSSMKTSLRGSRVGCFSRHAARAAATSGRFCSAAQSVFFIAEPQTLQKPTDRRLPDFNASFSQRLLQIKQRRAWRLLDKLTNNSLVRGELRLAVTAEITRSKISCRSKTLHQLDHETHADAKLTSSFVARSSPLNRANHAGAKIVRIRFGHLSRPPVRLPR